MGRLSFLSFCDSPHPPCYVHWGIVESKYLVYSYCHIYVVCVLCGVLGVAWLSEMVAVAGFGLGIGKFLLDSFRG